MLVSRPLVLVNAVKISPPSVKLGVQGPSKLVFSAIFSKIVTFCGGYCAVVRWAGGPEMVLFCMGEVP